VTIQAVKADVFEELERLKTAGETFDIVLADPPPFVKSKKDLEPGAKSLSQAGAAWAAEVTAPGGLMMIASCSHNIPPERFCRRMWPRPCCAPAARGRPDPPGRRRAGSSGASLAAGKART